MLITKNTLENISAVLKIKLTIHLPQEPILGIYPREMKICLSKDFFMNVHAALFIITPKKEVAQIFHTEWINCGASHNGIPLRSTKNELVTE